MSAIPTLSSDQVHALLDILSHHEVYKEIEDFRYPGTLTTYGPPFDPPAGQPSTSPSLQTLVSRFILTLPGLKNVSTEFWQQRCGTIIDDLAKAELSESYDKGLIGIRRTLATAVSSLVEYPVRGVLGGFDRAAAHANRKEYDLNDAGDLQQSFRDLLEQAVYGDMIQELFTKAAETDKLSDHRSIVQAAHQYIVVNLASFLHYILIISPKGQGLLALIDHANKLVPYTIIRQTLKIGNVASMLNALMKIILAKMSVASVTNWIGLTHGSDQGMNLFQEIIWTVLHWDIRDFKSRASKIEKSKESLSKDQLNALREYAQLTREEHEIIRETSAIEHTSIVSLTLAKSLANSHLTPTQHNMAQEYLALHLSIRDREQIVKVLCHSSPDHLTQAIKDGVAAYEPMIRQIHDAVDLSGTLYDFEVFLRDLLKLSKLPEQRSGRQGSHPTPTVGDFVLLLMKHQSSTHKFLHQCAKNGKEVTSWFFDYAKFAASQFQQKNKDSQLSGAGDLTISLKKLFSDLPIEKQEVLIPILNKQTIYIKKLHEASAIRLRSVVASPTTNHPALDTTSSRSSSRFNSRASSPAHKSPDVSSHPSSFRKHIAIKSGSNDPEAENEDSSHPGPGAFLARWQSLLDATAITPSNDQGDIRTGVSPSVMKASSITPDQSVIKDEKVATHSHSKLHKAESRNDSNDVDEDDDYAEFHDALTGIDELGLDDNQKVPRPDTKPIVDALLPAFRKMLGERTRTW